MLFSQNCLLSDLGMVDPKVDVLDLDIAGRDFTITQSPGILQSTRGGGTTGAAVWQTSVRFAEWLASSKGALKSQVIRPDSTVVELGSGISGVVPCMLSPIVKRVVATDQNYLLKSLRANILVNTSNQRSPKVRDRQQKTRAPSDTNVEILALDWELDDVPNAMKSAGLAAGADTVVACDCIFNYSLIDPFVQTCVDICKLRQSECGRLSDLQPTVCLVAQQLRQAEVFGQWLETFMQSFRTWRVPDAELVQPLNEGSGFVVHIGILR